MLSGLGQRTEGELLPVAVRDQGGVGLVPPTPPPLEQLLRILAQLGLPVDSWLAPLLHTF